MKKIIYIFLMTTVFLFSSNLSTLYKLYEKQEYTKACDYAVKYFYKKRNKNSEQYLTLYGLSCLETDKIHRIATPMLRLKNTKDAIVRIYAPSLDSELLRVIKSGGLLFTVTPAPRHLFELREKIYEKVTDHQAENNAPMGFEKTDQINLNYQLNITEPDQLKNLINMTPFAWKFSDQMMNALLEEKRWDIECDFNIEVYRKL